MIASQHGKNLPKLFGFEVGQVVKQNSASGRRVLPFLGGELLFSKGSSSLAGSDPSKCCGKIFRLGEALVGGHYQRQGLALHSPFFW